MFKTRASVRVTLGALAVIFITAGAAGGDSWVSVTADGKLAVRDATLALAPGLAVAGYDKTGIDARLGPAGVVLSPQKTPRGTFISVTWPEAPVAGEVGTPALPVVRRLFTAPPDTRVQLSVSEGEAVVIDLSAVGFPLQVMPVQPPVPKLPGARAAAEFILDESAYAAGTEVLARRATVEELGVVREQRLFLLELRPVAYNPGAGTLTLWPEIEVRIDFVGEPGPTTAVTPMRGLQRIVLNPVDPVPASRGSGNYLIITGTNFEAGIASFAAAKQAQGFTISTHAVTPGSANTTIKSYIQSLWDGGDAPDYILLVGDTETIPHWIGGGTSSPHTDLQYACMDGASDWYPDIAIGRFPVDNSTELQVMVDKTLYYENGPLEDPEYKKRAVFMASVDNYQISEGTHNYVINNYLEPNGYEVDRLYQVTHGATTQDVRNSFNAGRFYGVYSGHGGTYSWSDGPAFSQSDVNNLTNENMYAFICSFACVTGTFSVDECFMETWVLAPDKGAVASCGSSVNSMWDEDDILEKRLFDAIFDNTDDVVTEAGPIYNEAKMRYLAYWGATSTTRRYFEMYNLMGDPALPLPSACSDAGEITLDRDEYACEGTAWIVVTDCGLNLNDSAIDTVAITIASDSEPGGETVTLYETDSASAQFEGPIVLSATGAAGVLQVAAGDTVTATYVDADDGEGGINVEVIDTAEVDCVPPQISNVHASDIEPRRATIMFSANEPARGTVHYGFSCDSLSETAVGSGYSTTPSVNVIGLQDSRTYCYSVEAEDQAGNSSSDDNGGNCYVFATPEIPNFFTELFSGDNDLDNLTLVFTPIGSNDFYAGCVEEITSLPTDPTGGSVLDLSDDDSEEVGLTGGAAVSIYGTSYDTFYVGSNGYITFVHGDGSTTESLTNHFSGIPRISGLFDDLNPTQGGSVSWKQLADRAVVTWDGVPEHNAGNSNTFQIEMLFDGTIVISYLSIAATDGLAGLSAGTGLDPDFLETDLSGMGGCGPRPPRAHTTTVETPVDTPVTITLLASDDGLPDPPAALTYTILSLPQHGVLTDLGAGTISGAPYALVGSGNQVEYTPVAWYSGSDSFQFKVNDGGAFPEGGDSNTSMVSITVGGPQAVYVFDLETDPGWTCAGEWQFGQPLGGGSHNLDPSSGFTGDNVYGYNLAGDYPDGLSATYLTTTALDCTLLSGTELRFHRWLGVESATFDHATLEVSNNGTEWVTLWNHSGNSLSEASWSLLSYDISEVADGESEVYLRWGMGPTDEYVTYPGWNIDDIEIWGMLSLSDCNGNDVPDHTDIAEGTSQDCNDNNSPDECDLSFGISRDCNGNDVPDECDIAGGTSGDLNEDGVPDECETAPPLVSGPPHNVSKNRYIAFDPNNSDKPVAFQVELAASDYYPESVGVVGWVDVPDASGVARLVSSPVYRPWPEAVVLAGDCEITPAATYTVRAIVQGSPEGDPLNYSDPLAVETAGRPGANYWADCVGTLEMFCSGDGVTPCENAADCPPGDVCGIYPGPDGFVNFNDIGAAVKAFAQLPGTVWPEITWVDIHGDEFGDPMTDPPNYIVNFSDVQQMVLAFQGNPYPFSAPADCP